MATSTDGAEEVPANNESLKEKSSVKDEGTVPNNLSQDVTSKDPLTTVGEEGSLRSDRDPNDADPPSVHYPQPQTIYFGGYGNAAEWEEYSHYLTPDLLDLGSPGIYNENQSLMFPTGYGYNVQLPFGPFSPVSPSPPSARDGQMYSTQQFSFSGPYFHQSVPPNMPYLNSPTPLSQADLAMPVAVEHQGAFHSDASNSNGLVFGQRSNYPSYASFGRNTFSGNSGNPNFYDSQQGFDGFGNGGVWSDWMKSADGQRSLNPLSPTPMAGAFGHTVTPFSSGQAFQQQRPVHGFGSLTGSYARRNLHGGMYNQGGIYGSSFRTNDRGWTGIDKSRRPAKETAAMCSCNGTVDFLSEQNRGPRSTRQKNLNSDENSSVYCKTSNSLALVDQKSYNKPDFVTEYKDAKFFIIKSYSEDNIHKSIKYGVWTSTPNGNRKLDAAFREAKEKGDASPVFLFFSVNASAQFCGVAEMIGPVDFEKSVDYWQQNKWCGHFPVKWHIVKDVPNSVLRHIILENNDNKPVTNSRDTQEVKLEHGLEMLSIFKKYESDMSILDDFDFYETRQKAMQERKAWRQQNQSHPTTAFPVTGATDQHHSAPLNLNFVSQMSKTFAEVVRLDESRKEEGSTADAGCTESQELANSADTVAA